jgi:hypothetical protein
MNLKPNSTRFGDELTAVPRSRTGPVLAITGPFAAAAGPDADNLVLRAARRWRTAGVRARRPVSWKHSGCRRVRAAVLPMPRLPPAQPPPWGLDWPIRWLLPVPIWVPDVAGVASQALFRRRGGEACRPGRVPVGHAAAVVNPGVATGPVFRGWSWGWTAVGSRPCVAPERCATT